MWLLVYEASVSARLEQLPRVQRTDSVRAPSPFTRWRQTRPQTGRTQGHLFQIVGGRGRILENPISKFSLVWFVCKTRLAQMHRRPTGLEVRTTSCPMQSVRPKSKKRRRRGSTSRHHNVDNDGAFVTNGHGMRVCKHFHEGQCEITGLMCPKSDYAAGQ